MTKKIKDLPKPLINNEECQTELTRLFKNKNQLKKAEKVGERLINSILNSAVREGLIDIAGKSEEEIRSCLVDFADNFPFKSVGLLIALDHTQDILSEARKLFKQDKHHLAAIIYAIWLEHWINRFISSAAHSKDMSDQDIMNMIKLPFDAKTSWLLRLFDFKPINEEHRKIMRWIMDERNAYIHYKWSHKKPTLINEDLKRLSNALQKIEATIKYLNRYEKRYMLGGNKKLINLLKEGIKQQMLDTEPGL